MLLDLNRFLQELRKVIYLFIQSTSIKFGLALESYSVPIQLADLDDKSYLLYANEHRSEFERIESSISVEQRKLLK